MVGATGNERKVVSLRACGEEHDAVSGSNRQQAHS